MMSKAPMMLFSDILQKLNIMNAKKLYVVNNLNNPVMIEVYETDEYDSDQFLVLLLRSGPKMYNLLKLLKDNAQ